MDFYSALQVGLKKPYREVFVLKTNFVRGSRVLDTFFYALLRKTLELTELELTGDFGSCGQGVTSSRFCKKPYREVLF